jgi:hypothetical protein
MSDTVVLTTPEQTEALNADLDRLLAKYRLAGKGHPDARRIAVHTVRYPLDLESPSGR